MRVAAAGVGAGERPSAQSPVQRQAAGTICSISAEPFQSFSWRP